MCQFRCNQTWYKAQNRYSWRLSHTLFDPKLLNFRAFCFCYDLPNSGHSTADFCQNSANFVNKTLKKQEKFPLLLSSGQKYNKKEGKVVIFYYQRRHFSGLFIGPAGQFHSRTKSSELESGPKTRNFPGE